LPPAPPAQPMPPSMPRAAVRVTGCSTVTSHLRVDAQNRRQRTGQRAPLFAAVVTDMNLAAGCAEIHAERIEAVGIHAVAQYRNVTMGLRQPAGQCRPVAAAVLGAVDAQPPVDGGAKLAGVLRDDEQRVRIAWIQPQRVAEIAG